MNWYYNFSRPEFDHYELTYYIVNNEYRII